NELVWAEKRSSDGGALRLRADYQYDGYGDRLQKAVDNNGDGTVDQVQSYALDGWDPAKPAPVGTENWDVWAELGGDGSLTTRYLRGDAVDQAFARLDSGLAYWLLSDRLGSERDVTDGTGVPMAHRDYDGFGKVVLDTGEAYAGRYAWGSRELDLETGFQYNR